MSKESEFHGILKLSGIVTKPFDIPDMILNNYS